MDINTCFETTKQYHTIAYYSHLVPVRLALFLSAYAVLKTKLSKLAIGFFSFTLRSNEKSNDFNDTLISNGCFWKVILPASTFAKSSMSFMSSFKDLPLVFMASTNSFCSVPNCVFSNIFVNL